jgi:hypothetical protein
VSKIKLALLAAACATVSATAASAATFYTVGPIGADGSFTVVFGDLGINTTSFDDVFTFAVPASGPSGKADFTVTSTMSQDSQNITFSSVTFDGHPFDVQVSGWNETRTLNHVPVSAGTSYSLELVGQAGSGAQGETPNASYSGVITFAPTGGGVPEPASWALMIAGFGGTGVLLRRRRAALAASAA